MNTNKKADEGYYTVHIEGYGDLYFSEYKTECEKCIWVLNKLYTSALDINADNIEKIYPNIDLLNLGRYLEAYEEIKKLKPEDPYDRRGELIIKYFKIGGNYDS